MHFFTALTLEIYCGAVKLLFAQFQRCFKAADSAEMEMRGMDNDLSAVVPDWSRESTAFFSWQPSRSLLASMRSYQRCAGSLNPLSFFLAKLAIIRHRFWSVVTGADIPLNSHIAGGLLLPHANGVVIHPDASIGPNCLIFQQVTIGTRGPGGAPQIGGHVDIGAGAKVLGPVKIGEHAVIGANAVVLTDVPAHCMAVGIPAVIKPRKYSEE
jgi:serine O-acetyltransferase